MSNGKEKKRINIKRRLAIALAVFFGLLSVFFTVCVGTPIQLEIWEYWQPDYEKKEITSLLEKAERTKEDYEILYRQTGLSALGIEDFLLEEKGVAKIKKVQDYFFSGPERAGRYASPVMYMDETSTYATIAPLQDGDILVTATTIVSWWRVGHSALVVDGKGRMLLESIGVGSVSEYNNAVVFENLANFILLRPKADKETKAKVVAYAKENLVGLPYFAPIGALSKKYPDKIKNTQCAHLIWYAYKRFGVDLDGNGGSMVFPKDIANSKQVEVVQVYGFDLERLWK